LDETYAELVGLQQAQVTLMR